MSSSPSTPRTSRMRNRRSICIFTLVQTTPSKIRRKQTTQCENWIENRIFKSQARSMASENIPINPLENVANVKRGSVLHEYYYLRSYLVFDVIGVRVEAEGRFYRWLFKYIRVCRYDSSRKINIHLTYVDVIFLSFEGGFFATVRCVSATGFVWARVASGVGFSVASDEGEGCTFG